MKIIKFNITPRRRANLEKLADHLESLPEDYSHFEMSYYYEHDGDCDLAEALDEKTADAVAEGGYSPEDTLFARSIESFLGNCGAVACAVGHGPAAGVPLADAHIKTKRVQGVSIVTGINFDAYCKNFVSGSGWQHEDWEFLFGDDWSGYDNHHWGAAARIRFFLEHGGIPAEGDKLWGGLSPLDKETAMPVYEPYRVDKRQPVAA